MLETPLGTRLDDIEYEYAIVIDANDRPVCTDEMAKEYNALAESLKQLHKKTLTFGEDSLQKIRELGEESLRRTKILDALEAEVKKLREERKDCPQCSK